MIHEMGSKGLRPVWKLWRGEGSGVIDGVDQEVVQVAFQVAAGRGGGGGGTWTTA